MAEHLMLSQAIMGGQFGRPKIFYMPNFWTKLGWTHYRELMRISSSEARAFYEKEAIANNWSARELQRQR